MRDLIIRNLDDALLVELKRRAWHQGLPLEESLRRLLVASVETEYESEERNVFVPLPRLGPASCVALHA
ncbi:MAG: hypothetical protein EXR00_09380 [Alphaproteobacteria bacterium]|nr:hypothetical protein [Alphaproteobacteria bacterium]